MYIMYKEEILHHFRQPYNYFILLYLLAILLIVIFVTMAHYFSWYEIWLKDLEKLRKRAWWCLRSQVNKFRNRNVPALQEFVACNELFRILDSFLCLYWLFQTGVPFQINYPYF
ncbi:hypothetical protein CRE_27636 [Caenorhabditis remanei]|uniref:Uncharacterized protein n=1 Tax=Caenorhabditis remanei TaxID=31234 RepID=E3MKM8_CAERE|nr:hypothetical protein CRE_27636 [Caenorhabditis remanei]